MIQRPYVDKPEEFDFAGYTQIAAFLHSLGKAQGKQLFVYTQRSQIPTDLCHYHLVVYG